MRKSYGWLLVTAALSGVALAFGFLGLPAVAQPANSDLLKIVISPDPPGDEDDGGFPGNPIDFFDNYSWRIFVALNWPAQAERRGIPDRTKAFNTDTKSPRVWETWKTAEEMFYIPGGRTEPNPTEWDSFEGPSLCPEIAAANVGKVKTLMNLMKIGTALADLNQVDNIGLPVAPLIAQNRTYVRYEIRMNKPQYDFIRDRQFYLRSRLQEPQNQPIVFPNAAVEIKAAWREFKPEEPPSVISRYYQTQALALDPKTGKCIQKTFGLVGFHIAQKTPTRRQWIWSTFEHIDNIKPPTDAPPEVTASFNDPTKSQQGAIAQPPIVNEQNPLQDNPDPVQVFRQFPLPSKTAETNQKWHNDPQIKGTVWANYELTFTQWPTQKNTETGPGAPFPPNKVYNVTMETYMQSSSCISCHLETTQKTDFVWFLSNRAFSSSKTKLHADEVKAAATKALSNGQ